MLLPKGFGIKSNLSKRMEFSEKKLFAYYQVDHKSILDLQLESFVPKFHHSTWTRVNLRCITMYTYYATILVHVMLGSFLFKSKELAYCFLRPHDIHEILSSKCLISILRQSHRIPLCNNLVCKGIKRLHIPKKIGHVW